MSLPLPRNLDGDAVSPLGLGGASWSLSDPVDDQRSIATIRSAVEAGITLIDTARAYTTRTHPSHNESLIARALHGLHPEVLVATKGGHYRSGDSFPIDGRPEALRADCISSLRWLKTDCIDLYFLHHVDPDVPISDSVGALVDLRLEGKIRHIGLSNVTVQQIKHAGNITRIAAIENRYSPFNPDDVDVLQYCEARSMTYLVYSPLGGSRQSSLAQQFPGLQRLAVVKGVSVQQVILAWLAHRSEVLIPIVGAGRPETAIASAAAVKIPLTVADLDAITEAITAEAHHSTAPTHTVPTPAPSSPSRKQAMTGTEGRAKESGGQGAAEPVTQ